MIPAQDAGVPAKKAPGDALTSLSAQGEALVCLLIFIQLCEGWGREGVYRYKQSQKEFHIWSLAVMKQKTQNRACFVSQVFVILKVDVSTIYTFLYMFCHIKNTFLWG